jgi:isopentenyl-diphosphate delta-isomerase
MQHSFVILVDREDQQVGVMEKMLAHQKGLLHRAFSVFVINDKKEMLLQRRALSKYHSPGLWTNACCSHPAPNEETSSAANRRLNEEMGFHCELEEINTFSYKSIFDNGLTEHEFDHVFLGTYNGSVLPEASEVAEYKWISFHDLDKILEDDRDQFTTWFHLAYPLVKNWLNESEA